MAEDDRGLGEVLGRGLREKGYVVDVVPDGEAALRFLKLYEYAVVVLDWRMPVVPGWRSSSGCAAAAPRRPS